MDIKEIFDVSIARCEKITNDLLASSSTAKKHVNKKNIVDVNQIIQLAIKEANPTGAKNIEFNIKYLPKDYSIIKMDVTEIDLSRIISNCFTNSIEACADINSIPNLSIELNTSRGFLKIQINDNGPGFQKNVISNLNTFDKNSDVISTKSYGHGIGLSSAISSLSAIGGRLCASNIVSGRGARIEIQIPIVG